MSITINGQLLLCMLAEEIVDTIEDCQILQINTDGITINLNRNSINIYKQICKDWEEYTKLQLEYVEYSLMVIKDVNNYFAVTTNNKHKYKGAFEINKEYHKDNSFKIVPIALSEYFTKGTPIEDTIKSHKNIYNFCGRQKFKGEDKGYINWIDLDKYGTYYKKSQVQQKNVRYYISTKGYSFIKHYAKGSGEFINKGYRVTIFNKYQELEWKEYNVDYSFYIKECQKIINQIEDKQLNLF